MTRLNTFLAESTYPVDEAAIAFCQRFISGDKPRYVFGRNSYAETVANAVDVVGYIDDFTNETQFAGKPVFRASQVPADALVVSAVVLGRPITASQRLQEEGLAGLDYFAFQKYSGVAIPDPYCLAGFQDELNAHRDQYESLLERLADAESKRIFTHLLNFRLSRDLRYMQGFVDAQDRQYFEDFLRLQEVGETFLDVGCFDGYTSEQFIRRCPGYEAVHVFEPDPANMQNVKRRLQSYGRIHYHPVGASYISQHLRLKSNGSASTLSDDGDLEIRVEPIDEVIAGAYSFLKMDIEGAELPALEGARRSIAAHHPRLAISAYHRPDDLRRIPELVLSIRDDYDLFLRHYTEGLTETVLFFMPRKKP